MYSRFLHALHFSICDNGLHSFFVYFVKMLFDFVFSVSRGVPCNCSRCRQESWRGFLLNWVLFHLVHSFSYWFLESCFVRWWFAGNPQGILSDQAYRAQRPGNQSTVPFPLFFFSCFFWCLMYRREWFVRHLCNFICPSGGKIVCKFLFLKVFTLIKVVEKVIYYWTLSLIEIWIGMLWVIWMVLRISERG